MANSTDHSGGIAGERLLSFVERVFQLDEEIKALTEGKKEIFLEAKSDGYDVKILKEVLRIMKQDKDERDEHELLLDVYLRAIEGAQRPKVVAQAA